MMERKEGRGKNNINKQWQQEGRKRQERVEEVEEEKKKVTKKVNLKNRFLKQLNAWMFLETQRTKKCDAEGEKEQKQ
jgi:hypothetical protein